MAANVLKEFLVRLGFKVDDLELKKFKSSLADTAKQVERIGTVAGEAAAVMGAAVLGVASHLSKLYFASKQSGASVSSLKAFASAAEQIGIDGDAAVNAIQSMTSAIRRNPLLLGFLKQLNVNPNQDAARVYIDMMTKLRDLVSSGKMAPTTAQFFASQFATDPDMLAQMARGVDVLNQKYEENRRLNEKLGLDKAAEDAKNFENHLKDLEFRYESLGLKIGADFLPIAEKFVNWLDHVVTWLIQADHATDGWSSKLLGLATALSGVVGAKAALGGAGKLLGMGKGASAAGGSLLGVPVLGAAAIGAEIVAITTRLKEDQRIRSSAIEGEISAQNKLLMLKGGNARDLINRSPALFNPGNLRAAPGVPTTERFRGGASIGRFASFGSDFEGLVAMARLLTGKLYAAGGINTVSGIIGRYAPGFENNTAAYVSDVSKRMGVAANEHLNLRDPSVLQSLMQYMIHHEQGFDPYNAKLIADAANYQLKQEGGAAARTTVLNQQTSVTVSGAQDPGQTGRAIAQHQQRVNGDAVRNLAGATR